MIYTLFTPDSLFANVLFAWKYESNAATSGNCFGLKKNRNVHIIMILLNAI
jgi:hypothetical protein